MRGAVVLIALSVLSACAVPDGSEANGRAGSERQVPSNTTPGIHIGGYANIGVVRSF